MKPEIPIDPRVLLFRLVLCITGALVMEIAKQIALAKGAF